MTLAGHVNLSEPRGSQPQGKGDVSGTAPEALAWMGGTIVGKYPTQPETGAI